MVGKALCAMMEYFGTDRRLVGHALKVYGFARAIGIREGLDAEKMEVLECAAALSNIGVPECLRIFGEALAEQREAMGSKVAGELLRTLDFPEEFVRKVQFLVSHQRSYTVEHGLALQILREAVAIARLDEAGAQDPTTPLEVRDRRLRTRAGREIISARFAIPPEPPRPVHSAAGESQPG